MWSMAATPPTVHTAADAPVDSDQARGGDFLVATGGDFFMATCIHQALGRAIREILVEKDERDGVIWIQQQRLARDLDQIYESLLATITP